MIDDHIELVYLVKNSVLHIKIDLGDDMSVKIKHQWRHLWSLGNRVWFSDQTKEEVRHLAVIPGWDISFEGKRRERLFLLAAALICL